MKIKEITTSIKKNSEELLEKIKKPFEKFVEGDIKYSTEIKTKKDFYEKKYLGLTVRETISLYEKFNSLCGLTVERYYYFDAETGEEEGASEGYKIHLYWFDCDDHLEYSTDYYPDMSNKVLYNKIRAMLKIGCSLVKIDWRNKH